MLVKQQLWCCCYGSSGAVEVAVCEWFWILYERPKHSEYRSLCFICHMLRNCAVIRCVKLKKYIYKINKCTWGYECNFIAQQPPTWLRLAHDCPKHIGGYCVVKWHLLVLCRISVVSLMQFITSRNILTFSTQARGSSSLVQFWAHLVVNSTGCKTSPCLVPAAYSIFCEK